MCSDWVVRSQCTTLPCAVRTTCRNWHMVTRCQKRNYKLDSTAKTKSTHLVDIECQTLRSLLMKQSVSEDVLICAVNPMDASIGQLFLGRQSLVDAEAMEKGHIQLCFKTDSTANSKEEGANTGSSTDSTANSSQEGANTGSNNSDRRSSLMNLAAAGF